MKAAPIPSDDARRLAALDEYAVLDTPGEARFDELTKLAAGLLGVPIALISIVDASRQWFKSRYGLDAPETPRDVSFCGHVVAEGQPLVVPDAHADERFADNPLVTGAPQVRFYAGIPLRTPEGFVLGTLCAIDREPRVITEQQRELLSVLAQQVVAHLELRRSQRRLVERHQALETHRRFFTLGHDLYCTTDATGYFRELNPAWERVLGYPLDELRARPWIELVHPEDVVATREEASSLVEGERDTFHFENRYRHRDGRWVPLSWVATSVGGTVYATARDMSAYREKEAALAQNQEALVRREIQLRALFQGMAEGVVLQAPSGEILECNSAAEQILGLSLDQMRGRTSVDPRWRSTRADGSPFPGAEHPAMVALGTGQPQRDVRMGIRKPNGDFAWITINAQPLHHAGEPKPFAVVTTFRDVTQQLLAEEALAAERSFLSALLHEMPGALVALFDDALIVHRVFGAQHAGIRAGQSLAETISEEQRAALVSAARQALAGEPAAVDLVHRERRYDVRFVPRAPGSSRPTIALFYDVTERDRMREQLARQERLVTAGTLAAGVGHEINNPLLYVMTNIDVVIEELRSAFGGSPSSRMRDILSALDEARQGADRIRKIVRGLRAFARADGVAAPTDVHATLEISANMAMHEVRQKAQFSSEQGVVPPVFADESRLSQVFVNLIVNAAQAFPRADPAHNRITVRTRTSPSGDAVVEVSDNGPGIPPEVLPRIFDPFFTTKPVGIGTGLGLSICHNVVTGLGGSIECQTGAHGTTFRVTLPAAPVAAGAVSSATISTPTGPRGRVMIVDDEEVVLRSVMRLLDRDHDVQTFSDPRQALAALLASGGDFDVVLCDIMMPHLTGMDLYHRVREAKPELAERFVFITGGVTYEEVRVFLDEVPNERLEKPFSNQNLRGIARRFVGRGEA